MLNEELKKQVLGFFRREALGYGYRKTLAEIHRRLAEIPERDIRSGIQMLRLDGIPIVSLSEGGYFLASAGDGEHVEHFVAEMRHRANEIRTAAEAVSEGFGRMFRKAEKEPSLFG